MFYSNIILTLIKSMTLYGNAPWTTTINYSHAVGDLKQVVKHISVGISHTFLEYNHHHIRS
jgi:hypothetical protein